MKAIKSLHSIPGWFQKVRTRISREQTTFQKDIKDMGFRKVGKLKKYKKQYHG